MSAYILLSPEAKAPSIPLDSSLRLTSWGRLTRIFCTYLMPMLSYMMVKRSANVEICLLGSYVEKASLKLRASWALEGRIEKDPTPWDG